MKVIAIALIFLILPISVFAEDIPIIKPVPATANQPKTIRINEIIFYIMLAGDILAVTLTAIWTLRRFFDYV